jgi:ATP-dependent protease ClpP protease subunit
MSGEEAKEYGIVDEVIRSMKTDDKLTQSLE